MTQLTELNAANIAGWLHSKSTVTGSMKQALTQGDVMPFILSAKEAGSFDNAYIAYPDRSIVSSTTMRQGYDPTVRPWYI